MANHSYINKEFNPLILTTVLKRNWYWILVFPIIAFTLGYFYLRYTKPIYDSNSIIQIQETDQGKQVLNIENLNSSQNALSSNIELLKSPVLFQAAVNRLDLEVVFYNKGNVITSQLYGSSSLCYKDLNIVDSAIIERKIEISGKKNNFFINYELEGKKFKQAFEIGKKIQTPHFEMTINCGDADYGPLNEGNIFFSIKNTEVLAKQLHPNLQIIPLNREAQTIEVRFEADNANLARDIVEAVVEEFFIFDEQLKKKSAENVIYFLDSQLDSLSKELNVARDSIVYFQQVNKLNSPESKAEQLIHKLDTLDENIQQARLSLVILQNIKSKINEAVSEKQLEYILIEVQNEGYSGTVGTQITDLSKLIADRNLLLTQVQPENLEVQNKKVLIEQKISEIKKSIEILENRLNRNILILSDKKMVLEQNYLTMPEKKIEYARLRSTEELYAKYYSMLMEKKTQYAISNAGYEPSSRVLSVANINNTPIKPNKSIIYIVSVFVGVLISLAIIAIRYVLYNEIDTARDIEQILKEQVNIIGEVPQTSMHSEYSQIRIKRNKTTRLSEMFRHIRSNIQFIKNDYRTISVTSTVSGEGKTFVALNLATVIAFSGKKTIILDLDLRRPKVHIGLNTTNTLGVSNVLAKQNSLEECIKKTEIENLDLMTSGTVPPNPSELILKDEYDEMIAELLTHYDVVIIDTPPIGIVSDGVSIMSKVDVPIYVFRANYSKREYASQVKEIAKLLKLKAVNVVLNGVKINKGSVYGSYNRNNYYVNSYYLEDDE